MVALTKYRVNSQFITGGSNFSTSTTEHRITVPAGKKYLVHFLMCDNDVSATVNMRVCDSSDNVHQTIISEAATTAFKGWPQNTASGGAWPIPLSAGMYIKFDFGVAQTGAAIVGGIWEEMAV